MTIFLRVHQRDPFPYTRTKNVPSSQSPITEKFQVSNYLAVNMVGSLSSEPGNSTTASSFAESALTSMKHGVVWPRPTGRMFSPRMALIALDLPALVRPTNAILRTSREAMLRIVSSFSTPSRILEWMYKNTLQW